MNLFIDIDSDAATGSLGYDFAVNVANVGSLSRHLPNQSEFKWESIAEPGVVLKATANEIDLSFPWKSGGRNSPAAFDFDWADNCIAAGEWSDFTLNGDAAHYDRSNYRFVIH
jgi:hypothetical protein